MPRIANVVAFPTLSVRRRVPGRGAADEPPLGVVEFRLRELEAEIDALLLAADAAGARDAAERWMFLDRRRRELRARELDARVLALRALPRGSW